MLHAQDFAYVVTQARVMTRATPAPSNDQWLQSQRSQQRDEEEALQRAIAASLEHAGGVAPDAAFRAPGHVVANDETA